MDNRGWTADRCWLAADWNPRWFVAADQTQQTWTAEAAIAWAEIGGAPEVGDTWAVAVHRLLPASAAQQVEFEWLLFE